MVSFDNKELMVTLAGACFWYWNSFYSFLETCGVPSSLVRRYPRESHNKYQVMRNLLTDLEAQNRHDVLAEIVSGFYRMRNPVDRENLDVERARRLLQEFRDAIGVDPIEQAIERQEREKARAQYQKSIEELGVVRQRLSGLNDRFLELAAGVTMTPQQRGFALETLFFDLLQFSELEHTKPYRTSGGEQIDGRFRFEKFDYLVEVKWLSGPIKQPHLSVFDGKIRGKAQSTRGLFLGAEGFDAGAIDKFTGDAPRIVLVTGEDLALVLNRSLPFSDLLQGKLDAMVGHGRIYRPAREIMQLRMRH